ncbi:MAG TPA: sirohydrochlorin chelatase [Pirellulales bacterium]|nr:sirohydrochlorin chelatase [Pirellulales bacterium]
MRYSQIGRADYPRHAQPGQFTLGSSTWQIHYSMRSLVLIVGHGSRDAEANQEFERLVARYRARRPDLELRHGYVELAQPSLAEALSDIPSECQEVTLLPLFLFAAGHVKNDIPRALTVARREKPHVTFSVARELGVHPAMVELTLKRAEQVLPNEEAPRTTVIVVGRGTSDPDANSDFCKLARLLAEMRPFAWVVPTFIAVARPQFPETLQFVARTQPERLLVIPYLLFAGRLLNQLREQVESFGIQYPGITTVLAPQLGVDERLCDLLDERLDETRHGRAPVSCDGRYRVALPSQAENVGE